MEEWVACRFPKKQVLPKAERIEAHNHMGPAKAIKGLEGLLVSDT